MEPTSEQELKQLHDEGRITEDEYKELLEAIRQKEVVQEPVDVPPKSAEPKPKNKFGEAALVLFLLSIVIPVISILLAFVLSAMRMKLFIAGPFIFLGFLCALLAFIFGIIGWKSTPGKIAAIGVPCLGVLILPGLLLLSLFSVRTSTAVAVEQARSKKRAKIEELEELVSQQFVSHKTYALDSTEGILTQEGVTIDNNIFAEGTGSLKVEYDKPETRTFRLFETGPISIDRRMLIYSAKLRASGMGGKAYLEMQCHIPGSGDFFSRSIDQPVTQTTWTTTQTPFRLETGYMPDNVKLNLVIEGPGTVWIDDIKLLSSPLTSGPDSIYVVPELFENAESSKGVHPVNGPLY